MSGWDNIEPTVSLTLQMGWLLNQVGVWKHFHNLRVVSIVDNSYKVPNEEERIKNILHACRISCEVVVVPLTNEDFSVVTNSTLSETDVRDDMTANETLFSSSLNKYYASLSNIEKYKILNNVFKRNSDLTSL